MKKPQMPPKGIKKLKHKILIFLDIRPENRDFDMLAELKKPESNSLLPTSLR